VDLVALSLACLGAAVAAFTLLWVVRTNAFIPGPPKSGGPR
jgi:hypothetical protein